MLTDNSTQSPPYTFNQAFASELADLVIICPLNLGEDETIAFKVNRQDLAAHSTVFRDMLQVSQPDEEWEGLPLVKLEEPAKVVQVILGAVCNRPEIFSTPEASYNTRWQDAFAVWQAADKYGIHALRGYAQCQLRLLMPTVPPQEALRIQVRAGQADDCCLAQAALERAAQDRFPSEACYPLLKQMHADDLLKLVNTCLKSITVHALKLQQNVSQMSPCTDFHERNDLLNEMRANLAALAARLPSLK